MTDTLIHGLYREGEDIADTKAPLDVPLAGAWEKRKLGENNNYYVVDCKFNPNFWTNLSA